MNQNYEPTLGAFQGIWAIVIAAVVILVAACYDALRLQTTYRGPWNFLIVILAALLLVVLAFHARRNAEEQLSKLEESECINSHNQDDFLSLAWLLTKNRQCRLSQAQRLQAKWDIWWANFIVGAGILLFLFGFTASVHGLWERYFGRPKP